MSQSDLFAHEFRTARPPRPVYCHQEFLDKLALRRNESVGKRAALLLQRMAVDLARLHYKPTSGVNRGWRRSRLGGTAGSHFYAWWAPSGAAPVRNTSFQAGPESVFLRDIRHHDDHAPLDAGSLSKDYLPMGVSDLRGDEYAPEPWTASQARFARSRGDARILKGYPGSGKTTALLHAADESQAERVLYLTFSADLAALARDYFDRFCSGARIFTVLTYPVWIAQLTGRRGNEPDLAAARAQFRKDLLSHQRSLGPWSNDIDGLYDEMHAHLVGAAIPEKSGRFPRAERVRLPEAAYRAQRTRYLGAAATDCVINAARRLDRVGEAPLADRYFPELALAWRAAQARGAGKLLLANAILAIGATEQGNRGEHLNQIGHIIQVISEARQELPAWFIVEVTARAEVWLEELDRHLDAGDNPLLAQRMLPPFFDALGLPDAPQRKNLLAQRCVQILMKSRRYVQALAIIEGLPEAKPKLAAECYEGSGQFDKAAATYLQQGDPEKALRCFRFVPDFESALRLVRQMEAHPARAALEWLGELDALLARRPENFNRAMTPPEKKLLEAMLERGLGVQRKKPAVKKAASAARKTVPRKTAARKTAVGDPKGGPEAPTKRAQRKRTSEWF